MSIYPAIAKASGPQNDYNASLRLRTDDYSNLFQILNDPNYQF